MRMCTCRDLLSVLTVLLLSSSASAGLLARWALDDGPDPTAADNLTATNSVSTFDGTLINMTDSAWTTDTPSGAGYALDLNGSNQFVKVPDHDAIDIGSENFSISLWLKRDNAGVNAGVFDHAPGVNDGYQLGFVTSNTLRARLDSGPAVLMDSSDTITNDSQWHHVVLSFDRSQTTGGRIYIDGNLQTTQYDISGVGDLTTGQDLWLGQLNNNAYFNGKLDDVQFYDHALPRSLALQLMRNPNTITQQAAVEPGYHFTFDAAEPGTDPTNTWTSTTGFVGRPWVWTNGPTHVPDTAFVQDDSFPGIAAAYEFDGTAVATTGNYAGMQKESATFELWFRPSDTTGQEILLELGGTAGSSIFLDDSDVHFVTNGTGVGSNPVSLIAPGVLTDGLIEDFIQVAGVIDRVDGKTQLYINGQLLAEEESFSNIWTGTDQNGLGGINNLIGGAGAFDFTGYGNFDGEMAIYRWYRSALTFDQISNNFLAVTTVSEPVPEPSTCLLMLVGFAAVAGLRLRRRNRTNR